MKKKLILSAMLAIVLLSLGACSATKEQASKEASVEVSIDDFMNVNSISRELEVAKGGTVTVAVVLGSNQTTGFQWTEQAQIGDVTILEQTSHEYVSPEAEGGTAIVGAPGKEEWTFKALKSGITTVSMEYSRPWEGGEKGVWKFDLTVTVE